MVFDLDRGSHWDSGYRSHDKGSADDICWPFSAGALSRRIRGSAFESRQAEEIRDAFARHRVRYLFLGKSGMILLGCPDTTQDADVYVEKTPANGAAIVRALGDIGFQLTDDNAREIVDGKDFVQLEAPDQ